jgi:hypothetical protein
MGGFQKGRSRIERQSLRNDRRAPAVRERPVFAHFYRSLDQPEGRQRVGESRPVKIAKIDNKGRQNERIRIGLV